MSCWCGWLQFSTCNTRCKKKYWVYKATAQNMLKYKPLWQKEHIRLHWGTHVVFILFKLCGFLLQARELGRQNCWNKLWCQKAQQRVCLVDGAAPGVHSLNMPAGQSGMILLQSLTSKRYCTLMNIAWVIVLGSPHVYSTNLVTFSECLNFSLMNAFIFKLTLWVWVSEFEFSCCCSFFKSHYSFHNFTILCLFLVVFVESIIIALKYCIPTLFIIASAY